ncbi:hypothetical protein [Vibrio furnissii]|uniref:hypothetical protein n=1 Tax=Vibrio furnissii TaxID=29494 RepID=UPI001EEB0019|nr:hypothetical protein [Vibrio furnissii]MCG6268577.1 hypothetical protein [Vibrio furnissii]
MPIIFEKKTNYPCFEPDMIKSQKQMVLKAHNLMIEADSNCLSNEFINKYGSNYKIKDKQTWCSFRDLHEMSCVIIKFDKFCYEFLIFKLNNELKTIVYKNDIELSEIFTIDDLIIYLDKKHPTRNAFNLVKHTLNHDSNHVKLLMMNYKDSDRRLDSECFYIDRIEFNEYLNEKRDIEDVSVFDSSLDKIRYNDDIVDLHNTIILNFKGDKNE